MHFAKNADYGYVEYVAKCNENFALVCRKYSNEFHYVAFIDKKLWQGAQKYEMAHKMISVIFIVFCSNKTYIDFASCIYQNNVYILLQNIYQA